MPHPRYFHAFIGTPKIGAIAFDVDDPAKRGHVRHVSRYFVYLQRQDCRHAPDIRVARNRCGVATVQGLVGAPAGREIVCQTV